MSQNNFELVLRVELLEFGLDICDDQVSNALNGQVGDKSNREFSFDRSWDDGLGAWGSCTSA